MQEKVINLEVKNDLLSKQVVDAVFHVHKTLGPGLLESIYEECLVYTLNKRGLFFERQKQYPLKFEDMVIDTGLRLDLVVENEIILELKAVERVLPVHEAQILSYLKISGLKTGFLINFNVALIKDGMRRFALKS